MDLYAWMDRKIEDGQDCSSHKGATNDPKTIFVFYGIKTDAIRRALSSQQRNDFMKWCKKLRAHNYFI